LSQKTDLNIKITSINIEHYPQVRFVMHIENKAKLTLWGHLDDAHVDMDYTLSSDCIAIELCKIDDKIKIKGHVSGPFSKLKITGKGLALDGNVTYSAIKYTDKVENIRLDMYDVNSTKLFHLLGQDALITGKANASLKFSLMNKTHKKGFLTYHVKDEDYEGIALELKTKVTIDDDIHHFQIDINSPALTLNISKGVYSQEKSNAHAFYTLDIKDLSKLEQLLGYKYRGPFYARGEMSYDKYFKVTGLSKSFGGITDFVFEKDGLKIELKNVLLQEIMHLFPFPSMLTANADGHIYYNFIQNTLVVNTKLKNAKFTHSKLVSVIRKKSGANMLNETFDNSTLDLTYHNAVILGDLKLANHRSHIYLTSTKINTDKNSINAFFDFQMQKQEFSGKVFGSLANPNVNLNMQRLIRYQMDKQVDKMIGKNNRKIMEKMPMGGVAKDMATDMGASFIKVFF
jgi:hypothetical protein